MCRLLKGITAIALGTGLFSYSLHVSCEVFCVYPVHAKIQITQIKTYVCLQGKGGMKGC